MTHRLSCSAACGIFPDQGLSPSALADGFLTTGPQGKLDKCRLNKSFSPPTAPYPLIRRSPWITTWHKGSFEFWHSPEEIKVRFPMKAVLTIMERNHWNGAMFNIHYVLRLLGGWDLLFTLNFTSVVQMLLGQQVLIRHPSVKDSFPTSVLNLGFCQVQIHASITTLLNGSLPESFYCFTGSFSSLTMLGRHCMCLFTLKKELATLDLNVRLIGKAEKYNECESC